MKFVIRTLAQCYALRAGFLLGRKIMPLYANKNELYLSLAAITLGVIFIAYAIDIPTMGLIWTLVHRS